MTKADIVNQVSKNTGIEKLVVQRTIEATMETIKMALESGENVYHVDLVAL